jgi:hypothetical protein
VAKEMLTKRLKAQERKAAKPGYNDLLKETLQKDWKGQNQTKEIKSADDI